MRFEETPPETDISTHTLTWSVTRPPCAAGSDQQISTHTLTWSVTGVSDFGRQPYNYFNSHAHVERDLVRKGTLVAPGAFQLTRSRGA
mgnify:CR=1 FL=1